MRKNKFNSLYNKFVNLVGENTTTAPARPKVKPQTTPAPSAPPKPRRAPGPFTPTRPLTQPKPKALIADPSEEEDEVSSDKLAAKFLKRRMLNTFDKYK
jgi:hypothetical protein